MAILGNLVCLRAIEPADLSLLLRWSNDPDLQTLLGGWHFPSSNLHMEKWLQRIQTDNDNQRFAIETKSHGLIGTANLLNINWKDRNAFTGLLLGEQEIRGQGYGTDTIMAIMRYAFDELGLERLDTTIIEYNQASLHTYLVKCGWKEEGRKQNFYWRKGRFWDQVITGITRDQYLFLLKINNYWG